MLLYQPTTRQIKALALAAINFWPMHAALINDAALLLDPLKMKPGFDDEDPLYITWFIDDARGFSSEVNCDWNPRLTNGGHYRDGRCTCDAWQYHPWRLHLEKTTPDTPECIYTCKHVVAWHMYRKIVETIGAHLGYPEPLEPHETVWYNSPGLGRMVTDSPGLLELSCYLAAHSNPMHRQHAYVEPVWFNEPEPRYDFTPYMI